MAEYRPLAADEIDRELFRSFIRRQVVVKCWRRDEAGGWVVRDDPFIDDWSEEDYHALASCLRNTVQTGGVVYAAFVGASSRASPRWRWGCSAENSAIWT